MVRYSKLPFRLLVRKYGCDLTCTPMIVSESFVLSAKARDAEFTTCSEDRPLVAQFAASTAHHFARAAELISPYVDAVDLNCGCPQREHLESCGISSVEDKPSINQHPLELGGGSRALKWAMAEGYGCHLLNKPELVCEMVRSASARTSLPVSIKIRVKKDLKETVELVRRAEHCGVAWITVHGRTVKQRAEPASLEAIKLVKDSVGVPVVANGDIRSEGDVERVRRETGVDGVMSARGILDNPALYAGYSHTPLACVRDWLDLSLGCGVTFSTFHHHLIYMLDQCSSRTEKRVFNTLSSIPAVLDYLEHHYNITHTNTPPQTSSTSNA